MRWRNGNFRIDLLVNTLSANRIIRWPDRAGTVALNSTATIAFNAAVPFTEQSIVHGNHVVAGAINFTVASGTKYVGSRTIYRLVANGVNIPTYTGFVCRGGNYINVNGVVNIIEFVFDGSDHWYTISTEKPVAQTVAGTNSISSTYSAIAQNGVVDIASVTVPAAGVWSVFVADVLAVRYPLGGAIGSPATLQTYIDTTSNGRIYSYLNVDHAGGYRTTAAGEERTITHYRGTIFTGRFAANEVVPLRIFGNVVPISTDVLCSGNVSITRLPDTALL